MEKDEVENGRDPYQGQEEDVSPEYPDNFSFCD
jgi:hypothetical protein